MQPRPDDYSFITAAPGAGEVLPDAQLTEDQKLAKARAEIKALFGT